MISVLHYTNQENTLRVDTNIFTTKLDLTVILSFVQIAILH